MGRGVPRVRQAALVLLVTGVACGPDDPVERLARATPHRLLEPRLSGAFPAECPGVERGAPGACPFPRVGSREFDRLAAVTSELNRPTGKAHPEGERAAALAELVWSAEELGSPERAEAALEREAERRPDDAGVLSDLAAARLVRATAEGRAYSVVLALEAAERALAVAPDHAPALFNRALALEGLGMPDAAVWAWERYLESDASSAWAGEALDRTDALGARPAPDSLGPRRRREIVLDSLLPAWGERVLENRPGAERLLDEAEALARSLPDPSVGRMVAEVRRHADAGTADVRALARGLHALGQGRAAYQAGNDSVALRHLLTARDTLTGPDGELVDWADLWLASIALTGSRFVEVATRTGRVLRRRSASASPALLGLAGWIRGVGAGRQGRYAEALRVHERAAQVMEASGEVSYTAFLWSLVAEDRTLLGDPVGAWEARIRAFAAYRPGGADRFYQASLLEAALNLRRAGLLHAAMRIQEVSLDLARRIAPANLRSEALVRRATLRVALGDTAGARQDVAEARREAELVDAPEIRTRTLVDVWRAEATLGGSGAAEGALALARLDSATAFYRDRDALHFLVDLHVDRSLVRRRLGDLDEARGELDTALELMERGRTAIDDPLLGLRFADTAERMRDAGWDLDLRARWDPSSALLLAERVRGLATPWVGIPPKAVLDHVDRLPPSVAIVAYATLDDRTVAWVLRADGARAVALPVEARRVVSAATDLIDGARRADTPRDIRPAAVALSDLILPDTVRALVGDRDVVFVPDEALAGVPFATLAEGPGWMIENRGIAVSSSVALYLSRLELADDGTRAGSGGWLLAGDPAPGVGDPEALPRLPGARRELRELGMLYPGATTVTGQALAPATLLEHLRRPLRLFHFAGHAVSAVEASAGSRLVLAPASPGAGPSSLFAHELAAASVSGPELVVLTACQSTAPSYEGKGGFHGIALPFLQHGTLGVVGTLWSVEDEATAELSLALHRRLANGEPAGEALRQVQVEALSTGALPVRVWASFQLFGTHAGIRVGPSVQ